MSNPLNFARRLAQIVPALSLRTFSSSASHLFKNPIEIIPNTEVNTPVKDIKPYLIESVMGAEINLKEALYAENPVEEISTMMNNNFIMQKMMHDNLFFNNTLSTLAILKASEKINADASTQTATTVNGRPVLLLKDQIKYWIQDTIIDQTKEKLADLITETVSTNTQHILEKKYLDVGTFIAIKNDLYSSKSNTLKKLVESYIDDTIDFISSKLDKSAIKDSLSECLQIVDPEEEAVYSIDHSDNLHNTIKDIIVKNTNIILPSLANDLYKYIASSSLKKLYTLLNTYKTTDELSPSYDNTNNLLEDLSNILSESQRMSEIYGEEILSQNILTKCNSLRLSLAKCVKDLHALENQGLISQIHTLIHQIENDLNQHATNKVDISLSSLQKMKSELQKCIAAPKNHRNFLIDTVSKVLTNNNLSMNTLPQDLVTRFESLNRSLELYEKDIHAYNLEDIKEQITILSQEIEKVILLNKDQFNIENHLIDPRFKAEEKDLTFDNIDGKIESTLNELYELSSHLRHDAKIPEIKVTDQSNQIDKESLIKQIVENVNESTKAYIEHNKSELGSAISQEYSLSL